MTARSQNSERGFTLLELMVTIVAAVVLIVGLSAMLAYGHLGYNRLYRRANSEVVRNAYEARRIFDRAVRKSTIRRCDLRASGNEVYVYYFSDPQDMAIADPDRYAKFYVTGEGEDAQLMLERGDVTAGTFDTPPPGLPGLTPGSPMVIAHDVTVPEEETGTFSVRGAAVRMVLMLDNDEPDRNKTETLKMNVTTTAVRHNE
ncbi:MAG: prepilin-type N-terminal cleavage/methylation domain-containing protein [Planctomycetota bacterium]|jgi:hypothetical protein